MGIFSNIFGSNKKTVSPEIEKIFKKIYKCLTDEVFQNTLMPDALQQIVNKNSAVDELPDASGEFGKCLENPIPVNGPIGEVIYLSNIVTDAGERIFAHRLGSKDGIDIFETVSFDGTSWDILFFYFYYPRKSKKIPNGYKPGNPSQRSIYATNQKANDFPKNMFNEIKITFNDFFGISLIHPDVRLSLEKYRYVRPENHINKLKELNL